MNKNVYQYTTTYDNEWLLIKQYNTKEDIRYGIVYSLVIMSWLYDWLCCTRVFTQKVETAEVS